MLGGRTEGLAAYISIPYCSSSSRVFSMKSEASGFAIVCQNISRVALQWDSWGVKLNNLRLVSDDFVALKCSDGRGNSVGFGFKAREGGIT